MAKNKLKLHKLAIKDMFNNQYIFLAGTPEQVYNYFYEKRVEDAPNMEKLESTEGIAYSKSAVNIIVVFKDDIGVIVHECVHAIQQAMDDLGINTGVENTELTAYGTEWLVTHCLPFYTKYFAKLRENEK